jgi:hypothetical protein
MKPTRWLLAAALALAACGDDDGGTPGDDDPDAMEEPPPDGPPGDPTFAEFVIDQITNQTADDTDPVPFDVFATLEDVDLDNPAAFDELF